MLNDLFYSLPTAVDAVIIISFAVAVSVAGLVLTDRLVPVEVRKAPLKWTPRVGPPGWPF